MNKILVLSLLLIYCPPTYSEVNQYKINNCNELSKTNSSDNLFICNLYSCYNYDKNHDNCRFCNYLINLIRHDLIIEIKQ